MFKKENRLTKNKEFDNVWKKGKSSFDKILGVKALKNDLKIPRFGILVSIKVSKRAVDRNKIKRRIREIVKKHFKELKSGFDIVIIALPSSLNEDFVSFKKSIENNFKKLNLFK